MNRKIYFEIFVAMISKFYHYSYIHESVHELELHLIVAIFVVKGFGFIIRVLPKAEVVAMKLWR